MMYCFKFSIFAVKIIIIILYASSRINNGHSVLLENLKKEFRRPRRISEESFINDLGERVCKQVDSIMCLA